MLFKSLLLSNLAFVIKAISLLSISILLAESVSTKDFALWSLLISVSLFFTLSDFGVGQYLLRLLVEYRKNSEIKGRVIRNISAINVLLVLVVFLFSSAGFISLKYMPRFEAISDYELALFVSLISIRSLLTPYFVQLSANEWFYIQKNIEAFSSLLALLVVWYLIAMGASIAEIAIFYQLVFTSGALLAPLFCHYKKFLNLLVLDCDLKYIHRVIFASLPYFINNLSLLLTRGGFVFLIGFLVDDAELAEISVYYAVFFQVFYQLFDIVIRIIQPKILLQPVMYNKARLWLIFGIGLFFLGSLFFGEWLVNLFYPTIKTDFYTMLAFLVLSISEFIFSLLNLKWQMYSKYNYLVMLSSVSKALLYVVLVGFFSAFSHNFVLSYVLLLFCFMNFLSLFIPYVFSTRSQ